MGQPQLLGPGQKLSATSAEAGQAAPAPTQGPKAPGFKRAAVMLFGCNFPQAVLLQFSGMLDSQTSWWRWGLSLEVHRVMSSKEARELGPCVSLALVFILMQGIRTEWV